MMENASFLNLDAIILMEDALLAELLSFTTLTKSAAKSMDVRVISLEDAANVRVDILFFTILVNFLTA